MEENSLYHQLKKEAEKIANGLAEQVKELQEQVELFKNAHNMECTVTSLQRDENTSLKETIASLEAEIKELKSDIQGYIEDAAGASL